MSYQTMVLWSMIDANGHLRHSTYADLAAQARIYELALLGIDQEMFQQYKMGPVLFREETIYLREVKDE
jgi:acyl-CoA thioester hydrolase